MSTLNFQWYTFRKIIGLYPFPENAINLENSRFDCFRLPIKTATKKAAEISLSSFFGQTIM